MLVSNIWQIGCLSFQSLITGTAKSKIKNKNKKNYETEKIIIKENWQQKNWVFLNERCIEKSNNTICNYIVHLNYL